MPVSADIPGLFPFCTLHLVTFTSLTGRVSLFCTDISVLKQKIEEKNSNYE